jgi:hypothetical protein
VIQVDEILNDADVCSAFLIQRVTGQFAIGGWQANPVQNIPSFGAVRNSTGKEIAMLPEADQVSELLTFRSVNQMFVTNEANSETSDLLTWPYPGGDQYRVLLVKNYSEQGFWLALATRMAGS